MFLLSHTAYTVSEETFDIKLDDGNVVQYKEWSDQSGKIIDTAIKDKKGQEIEDLTLLKKIWSFVDKKAV